MKDLKVLTFQQIILVLSFLNSGKKVFIAGYFSNLKRNLIFNNINELITVNEIYSLKLKDKSKLLNFINTKFIIVFKI